MTQNERPEPNKGLTMLLTCGIMIPVMFILAMVGGQMLQNGGGQANVGILGAIGLGLVAAINQGVKAVLRSRMKPKE